ncbi:hypothetical protein ATANTOWER_023697 [Ataeniobius toweri]|uniref:Uncharacterized protein n=1 Tax=Ataeniobius toweri TaxID=208326 RepID=A0ABU7C073_9TELE|nr:hypothetical protein [Ataeniobius toweri]
MGKCKFIASLLDEVRFRHRLLSVADPYEARYILCKKTFKLCTMGFMAVESHLKCDKHKAAANTHICPFSTRWLWRWGSAPQSFAQLGVVPVVFPLTHWQLKLRF